MAGRGGPTLKSRQIAAARRGGHTNDLEGVVVSLDMVDAPDPLVLSCRPDVASGLIFLLTGLLQKLADVRARAGKPAALDEGRSLSNLRVTETRAGVAPDGTTLLRLGLGSGVHLDLTLTAEGATSLARALLALDPASARTPTRPN